MSHIPVLLQEVLHYLSIQPDEKVLDMTVGEGGHGYEIARLLSRNGVFIGIDADADAIRSAREELGGLKCRVVLYHGNFSEFRKALEKAGVSVVDKVLFDLGLRSSQLEESGRGFSFQRNEPLVMTFNERPEEGETTAKTVVNEWSEESLSDIIYGFGGERYARRIARAIARAREEKPISTTQELRSLIEKAVPAGGTRGSIHPATRTFQALRIAVNGELDVLEKTLEALPPYVEENGRIAAIAFHSLEDRIVKCAFREWEKKGKGKRLVKKPIQAKAEEVKDNPRSRSAKLRIFKTFHQDEKN